MFNQSTKSTIPQECHKISDWFSQAPNGTPDEDSAKIAKSTSMLVE